MNLMNALRSTEHFASEGKQKASEGTGRRAEEGSELMRIENQGEPLIEQATRNSQRPDYQLGIKFIPSFGAVKINYEPGQLDIQAQPQAPRIDVQVKAPIHNYTPDKIDIQMKQMANLEIDFINLFPEKE